MARRTFKKRITRIYIYLVTTCLFLMTILSIFLMYSVEDVLINSQLKLLTKNIEQTKALVSAEVYEKNDFPFELEKLDFDGNVAETRSNGRHLHIMLFEKAGEFKYLVVDASEILVVSQVMNKLLLIFGIVLFVLVITTTLIVSFAARRALLPFDKLLNELDENNADKPKPYDLEQIKELDLREIAIRFREIIADKSYLLEKQSQLNHLVSHELRTPLQVIKNELELLEFRVPEIANTKGFKRLRNSSERLESVAQACLWLDSNQEVLENSDFRCSLKESSEELAKIFSMQDISISFYGDFTFMVEMPKAVSDLVAYHILANAAHHSGRGRIKILLDNETVTISNPNSKTIKHLGFGIGLDFLSQVLRRFGYHFITKQDDSEFFVYIQKNSNPAS